MAIGTKPDRKPQMQGQQSDKWTADLNPDRLAGQNIGGPSGPAESTSRTAYDVKPVHRALTEMRDDELKQIPILDPGAHSTHRDQSVHAIVITGTTAS